MSLELLLAVSVTTQLLDVWTTWLVIQRGGWERNIVPRKIIQVGGFALLTIVKVGVAVGVAAWLWPIIWPSVLMAAVTAFVAARNYQLYQKLK